MATTKRKRRTKHRGNAAGVVESRGRTGRAPTPEERNQTGQKGRQRTIKPARWKGALGKAAIMAVLLFVLTRLGLFGKNVPIQQSVLLSVFAIALYTPLAYVTDMWVYTRHQRRRAGPRR